MQSEWHRCGADSETKISAYGFYYDLNLFSDFTYYLTDPNRCDQFEQQDRRWVAGLDAHHTIFSKWHLAAHAKQAETVTDSNRMFQWGVEQGRPESGKIGIAPEWFYKSDGSILRALFEAREIPGHAEDGGEEAELAGIYVIDKEGFRWVFPD
ncbi:MAG: hypothetical protein ABI197_14730 [Granulicella sp.]